MCCREIDINFKKIKKEKSEMENVMTKGFCELSENEVMEIEGGIFKLIGEYIQARIEEDKARMQAIYAVQEYHRLCAVNGWTPNPLIK